VFRPDAVVRPLLSFLERTDSYLFFDACTLLHLVGEPLRRAAPLRAARAVAGGGIRVPLHDPGTGLSYANLLDQMLDAVVAAACRVGHCGVKLALAETGWPTAGANVRNAATYNRNLASGAGTPRRPGTRIMPAMVFAPFDENLKWGARHGAALGPLPPPTYGSAVYEVDLTGVRINTPWCVHGACVSWCVAPVCPRAVQVVCVYVFTYRV
jgi:hypothetical protein